MKNILVTGGAGFIGSNFVRYVLHQRDNLKIINLDLLTYAGNLDNLKDLPNDGNHTFIKGDIRDKELVNSIFEEHEIDTVVHFAAESHVDRSILGPTAFIETNVVGTLVLLEAAKNYWLEDFEGKRFHHVSTDEVYGALAPNDPPFTEDTPYDPRSPYSASKASSDHLVRAYWHTFRLPVSISNCTNNYGPYQYPEKLIPVIITKCMAGEKIPVYGDGKQIRDWLHVEDHCIAIFQVIEEGNAGETYNIGGNNQPTNIEIIHTICKEFDQRFPESPFTPHHNLIEFVKDRPGHDRRYAMDITKIATELSWQPAENLSSGLKHTVDWYLSNLDWLSAIKGDVDYSDWMNKNYSAR